MKILGFPVKTSLLFLPEQIFPAYFTEKRYRIRKVFGKLAIGKKIARLIWQKRCLYIVFNRNPSY